MSEHVHGPDCDHGHGTPVKLGTVGGKEPCPCGSGKKYKHCCYPKDAAKAPPAAATPARPEAKAADEEAEAAPPEREHGRPKAPTIGKGPIRPPSRPPLGAAKALNRRSGHR